MDVLYGASEHPGPGDLLMTGFGLTLRRMARAGVPLYVETLWGSGRFWSWLDYTPAAGRTSDPPGSCLCVRCARSYSPCSGRCPRVQEFARPWGRGQYARKHMFLTCSLHLYMLIYMLTKIWA